MGRETSALEEEERNWEGSDGERVVVGGRESDVGERGCIYDGLTYSNWEE